jgi:hypothetical protein
LFDPDYRRSPWNNSRYAPKNSKTTITQTAILLGALVFVVGYFGIESMRQLPGLYYIVGLSFSVFFIMGILIRRREYRRLITATSEQTIDFSPTLQNTAKAKPRKRTGVDFEHEVAALISSVTGNRAEVVGGANDGGIDIKVFDKAGRLVGIVQCKDYQGRIVSPSNVRELATVKLRANVGIAYLVTSGVFSPDTKRTAEQLGIRLLDGNALERLKAKKPKV